MPYFCLIIALVFFSCNREAEKKTTTVTTVQPATSEKVKYVNSVEITSPAKKETFKFHDKLTLAFDSKERFPVDSAHIFLNGKYIGTTGKDIKSFTYTLPTDKTGNSTLKIVVFHPGHKRGVATRTVIVKPDKAPRQYAYEVVKTYPHDPKAYTQGLIYHDGFMYESTGQYGESGIRKSDINNGQVLSALNIDSKYFGEGIAIYGGKLYQLTWTARKGFVYDLKTFSLESTFNYNTQGWGLTTLDNCLLMSDGSHKLYHIAAPSFNILRETEVYDHNGPVERLNELEYIDGLVWANVWMQDRIVLIDPESGEVKGELDLSRLLPAADRRELDDNDDVLNGIAWNPKTGTVYVTGKRWPKMFEIKIK